MFSKNFKQYVKGSLSMVSYGILLNSGMDFFQKAVHFCCEEKGSREPLLKGLDKSFSLVSLGLSLKALSSAIE